MENIESVEPSLLLENTQEDNETSQSNYSNAISEIEANFDGSVEYEDVFLDMAPFSLRTSSPLPYQRSQLPFSDKLVDVQNQKIAPKASASPRRSPRIANRRVAASPSDKTTPARKKPRSKSKSSQKVNPKKTARRRKRRAGSSEGNSSTDGTSKRRRSGTRK